MATPATKQCEACDQEIGASETTCPKCGVVFEDLEGEVAVVTRAMTVAEKRKKKAEAEAEAERLRNEPPAPPKKKSFLRSLNRG
jgi:uncharacterized Zn finger protein (UPF0148 family)